MSREALLREVVESSRQNMQAAAVRIADRAMEGKPVALGESVDYQQARHAYRTARQELNQWLCDPSRLWEKQKQTNQ